MLRHGWLSCVRMPIEVVRGTGWTMQRELATDTRDLPHPFMGEGATCGTCERDARHALHHVIDIEQASVREVLQTEKGS